MKKEKQDEGEEKKEKEDLETINSESLETEKNNKEIKKDKKENKDYFSFCDFFLYKITFGKKNNHLELYEDFRKKVLGVENLTQNYLKMNNLIGFEKRTSKLSEKKIYK